MHLPRLGAGHASETPVLFGECRLVSLQGFTRKEGTYHVAGSALSAAHDLSFPPTSLSVRNCYTGIGDQVGGLRRVLQLVAERGLEVSVRS